MTVEVKVNEAEFAEANKLLQRVERRVRVDAVSESLSRASETVVKAAKREVPQPGYPGDLPGKKPLRDTLSYEIRDYPSGTFVAVVGAQYPAGAHAHLVHGGHEVWIPVPGYTKNADAFRTGKRAAADPFLERASDMTKGQQIQAIVSTMKRFADKV